MNDAQQKRLADSLAKFQLTGKFNTDSYGLAQPDTLGEAPIDDFDKNPSSHPPVTTAGNTPILSILGAALGGVMFMNVGPIGIPLGSLFGAIGGLFVGAVAGAVMDAGDLLDRAEEIDKARRQQALKMADTPISTEIRSDLRTFMNNMLNDIPDSISKYSLEISNMQSNLGYDEDNPTPTLDAPGIEGELNKRTDELGKVLADYINKHNDIFDKLAKKHNITPLQLLSLIHI